MLSLLRCLQTRGIDPLFEVTCSVSLTGFPQHIILQNAWRKLCRPGADIVSEDPQPVLKRYGLSDALPSLQGAAPCSRGRERCDGAFSSPMVATIRAVMVKVCARIRGLAISNLSRHSELLRIRTLPNSTWDTTAQMRTARSAATKRHVIELGVSPKQKERARHGSGGQHLQDDLSGSTSQYGGASLAEGRLHETKEAANRGGLTRPGPSPTRALYDGPFRVDGGECPPQTGISIRLVRVVPVRPPTEAA